MAEQTSGGIEIKGRMYDPPGIPRLVDPVLVRELTGLEWDEFIEHLPDDEAADVDDAIDPIGLLGLVAMAVWQQNPTWRRDRVIRFVTSLSREDIVFIAPEPELDVPPPGEPGGDDVDPPGETPTPIPEATEPSSENTPEPSEHVSDTTLETSTTP